MTRAARTRGVVGALVALAALVALGASSVEPTRAAFVASSANGSSILTSDALAPPTDLGVTLRCSLGSWVADLTWTPTTTTWADGYVLERWSGLTPQAVWTLTPSSLAAHTDSGSGLVGGVVYTYRLRAFEGTTWVSSDAAGAVTVPLLCL